MQLAHIHVATRSCTISLHDIPSASRCAPVSSDFSLPSLGLSLTLFVFFTKPVSHSQAKAPLHHEGTYLYNGGDLKKVEPMVGMPGCQKSRANVIAVCTEDFAKVLAMLLKPKEGVLRSDDRILTDAIISDG